MTVDVYSQIQEANASQNNGDSKGILIDVMLLQDWVAYSSTVTPDFERLVRRFYGAHARVPGVLSEEAVAVTPLAVVRSPWPDDYIAEGFIYTNGAIIRLWRKDPPNEYKYLYVSPETAKLWRYPKPVIGEELYAP